MNLRKKLGLKSCCIGVPAIMQWDQRHLGSSGTKDLSPAWNSGLRIWLEEAVTRLQLGLRSDPWPRTPYATGWPPKETNKPTCCYCANQSKVKGLKPGRGFGTLKKNLTGHLLSTHLQ